MASTIVRRSLLRVPSLDDKDLEACWQHDADAVILDLAGIPEPDREQARVGMKRAIRTAGQGGAEVFVKIGPDVAYADCEAAAWPGLTGILLPSPETAGELREIAGILMEMERLHGIPAGSLQIIVLLGSPAGVWNVREILQASPRVSSVALDEGGLCRSLGIMPRPDFDPFQYAKGRLVIEATAADVQPVGMSHPLGALPRLPDAEEIHRLAERGRNLGFKGTICPHPSWVEPCNRAFTPTSEQIDYYREVRRLFAEGVARGTAAVPMNGQMIDVPVDERARAMIALWERCRRRDAQKAAALAAARRGSP